MTVPFLLERASCRGGQFVSPSVVSSAFSVLFCSASLDVVVVVRVALLQALVVVEEECVCVLCLVCAGYMVIPFLGVLQLSQWRN